MPSRNYARLQELVYSDGSLLTSVYGAGLNDHETIPARLSEIVSRELGRSFECLNLGVSNFTTAQEVNYFHYKRALDYDPRIVVLGLYVAGVTWVSTFEEKGPGLGFLASGVGLGLLLFFSIFWLDSGLSSTVLILLLGAWLAYQAFGIYDEGRGVSGLVRWGVWGIVILDAAFCLGRGAVGPAVAVLALLVPVWLGGRILGELRS